MPPPASSSVTARTASSTPARSARWRTRCACRIYDILSQYGPQTASSLAERLGESSGSTSYHLRALAKHDLIREVEDRGTGRERWWERPVGGVSFANPDAMTTPAGRAATQLVMNEFFRNRNEQLLDFVNRGIGGEEETWQEGTLISTATARLTPEQSKELATQDHGPDRRGRGRHTAIRPARTSGPSPSGPTSSRSPTLGETVMTAISAPRTLRERHAVRALAAARGIRPRRTSSPTGCAAPRRAPNTAAPPAAQTPRPSHVAMPPQALGAIGTAAPMSADSRHAWTQPDGRADEPRARTALGRDFGKLWTAAAFSNLADGIGRDRRSADRDHADPRPARDLGHRRPWPSCRGSSSACPPA